MKEGGEDIEIQEFEKEIGAEILEKLLEKEIKTARDFLEVTPELLFNELGMDYHSIIDIRRVILLEFDEDEDDEYIITLRELAGIPMDDDIEENVAEEAEENIVDDAGENVTEEEISAENNNTESPDNTETDTDNENADSNEAEPKGELF
jgi:hypothetical protein